MKVEYISPYQSRYELSTVYYISLRKGYIIMDIQNITNKKTADQNEQHLNKLHEILFELCVLNKNLKNISDTLLYISQYGIITK